MLSRPVPKSFLQHLEMQWTSPGGRDVKVGGKCPDISWFCLGTKIKPPSSIGSSPPGECSFLLI